MAFIIFLLLYLRQFSAYTRMNPKAMVVVNEHNIYILLPSVFFYLLYLVSPECIFQM